MFRALDLKAYLDSLGEVFFVAIVSLLPLLLGGLIRRSGMDNRILSWASYKCAIEAFMVHGELFLYTLPFIATILWTAVREWPQGIRPPRAILVLFCSISISLIIVFYCLDTAKVALHINVILVFSGALFVLTLFFYFVSTVLDKIEAPDLAAVFSQASSAMAIELDEGALS